MPCLPLHSAAGAAAVLALCAASPAAWALPALSADELPPAGEYQPRPAKHDEPDMRIDLSPDRPGLSYRIQSEQAQPGHPPDSCDGFCTLYLAPGDYHFELFDHGHPAGSGTVDVKYDAVWHVKPQNHALEWVGLGAFVIGAGAAATGLYLVFRASIDQMGENPPASHRLYFPIGLGLGVAGAVLTPLGAHWFWGNRSPVYKSTKIQKDAWTRPIRVGVAPMPGGATFAARWKF